MCLKVTIDIKNTNLFLRNNDIDYFRYIENCYHNNYFNMYKSRYFFL